MRRRGRRRGALLVAYRERVIGLTQAVILLLAAGTVYGIAALRAEVGGASSAEPCLGLK